MRAIVSAFALATLTVLTAAQCEEPPEDCGNDLDDDGDGDIDCEDPDCRAECAPEQVGEP